MATIVIVPAAMHGGWRWKEVRLGLQAAGHEVYALTLTGLGERSHLATPDIGLDTHIQDVVNVLEYEDLRDVVLVGHSYGGAVITGVADRVADRLARIIYVDAVLPRDGECAFDVLSPQFRADWEEQARRDGEAAVGFASSSTASMIHAALSLGEPSGHQPSRVPTGTMKRPNFFHSSSSSRASL